jgi:hypothetical protein
MWLAISSVPLGPMRLLEFQKPPAEQWVENWLYSPLKSPGLFCDRCPFFSYEKLCCPLKSFCQHWWPYLLTPDHSSRLILSSHFFLLLIFFLSSVVLLLAKTTDVPEAQMYSETTGVMILTETNHQESGQKIRRDTKLMLLAGEIACRWRCWMELNGGQWKPNLSAVEQ